MAESNLDILLENHLTGVLPAADKEKLAEWLATPHGREQFADYFDAQINDHAFEVEESLDEVYDRLVKTLQQEMNKPQPVIGSDRPAHHIHFLKTAWFRYAAAVILVAGTITAVVVSSDRQHSPSNEKVVAVSSSDILPGRDRAILTLANGEQIILDSTQGNIVKKGGLTVINLAGKLKYEGVGRDADYNTISTPKGGQYQIVLPDGSKVWLNAASSIKFPTAFASNVRQVEMTGEAYMEIVRNPKQFFIVKVNGAEIQVLGTSFNVNAYQNESAVTTTLITGSVKVISGTNTLVNNKFNRTDSAVVVSSDQQLASPGTGGNKNAFVILKPGQQAVQSLHTTSIAASSDRQPNDVIISQADIEQALAWKNGQFNFNGLDVRGVMRQLERWYDIEVQYRGRIDNAKFKGKIDRSVNLSEVLDMLQVLGEKFQLEGKTLIVL